MKKLIIFLILIICVSCNESKNKESQHTGQQFNTELYDAILAYQAKVKIPKNEKKEISPVVKSIESALIYVYEIKFIVQAKDTIVSIVLNSGGINQYYNSQIQKNENIFGIYQDKDLKATYVNDPQKTGKKFIIEYIENPNALSEFYQKNDFINDDAYDVYLYKIRGSKLIFDEILKGNKS